MAEFGKKAEYENEAYQENLLDIKDFELAVLNNEYPKKCLQCYHSGLRYCRYWELEFYCDSIEDLDNLNSIIMRLKK